MVSSAIFLPKSTLLTDKLLNLNLFRSVNMTLDPEKNPNVDPRQCSYSHYERAEKLLIAMMAAGQLKLDTVDPKKGTDSGVGQIKTNLDTFFLWRDAVAKHLWQRDLHGSAFHSYPDSFS